MKWVLKIKDNGRYRARMVAKGFLQLEGIDYDLSHSPVLVDSTFRILLVYYLQMKNVIMISVDIKKAFLESKVEEESEGKRNQKKETEKKMKENKIS